jgi:hypothetical protein
MRGLICPRPERTRAFYEGLRGRGFESRRPGGTWLAVSELRAGRTAVLVTRVRSGGRCAKLPPRRRQCHPRSDRRCGILRTDVTVWRRIGRDKPPHGG